MKRLVYGVFEVYFKFRFLRLLHNLSPGATVYLVDIDNTLADTWPSLHHYVYRNENHRYTSLSVFIGMRNFILHQLRNKEKVIFISARSYLNYRVTQHWLISCGIIADELILVRSAADKLFFIRQLIAKKMNVVYIDDLSYNHEFGEVFCYEELITTIKKLPVAYLGINEIELINSTYEFNHQDPEKIIPHH